MVGTWKNGFIVLHQGQVRAVGQSEAQHHLLPVAARLIQGEPLRVVAERVAVRGEGVVQFWLKPGETAVTLGVGEDMFYFHTAGYKPPPLGGIRLSTPGANSMPSKT